MKNINRTFKTLALAATVLFGAHAQAQTVNLGTFNTGLTGWGQPGGSTVTWSILGGSALFNDSADVLRRNVAVVGGQQYVLSFDYLSFGTGTAIYLDFDNIGGAPVEYATADPGIAYGQSLAEGQTISYSFTALNTGNTRLRFLGATGSTTLVDNVSITAVPEPETYAMMLAGLGAIGFMARRRKAVQG